MVKDRFLFLLANHSSLTEDETTELVQLQDEYPYSQAIHNLVARGAQLNNLSQKQKSLTQAAIYSTDRAVLKSLITARPEERQIAPIESTLKTEDAETKSKVEVTEERIIEKKASKIEFTPSNLSGDALLDELFNDLDRLKKLKHDFEVGIEEVNKGLSKNTVIIPLAKKEKEVSKTKKESETITKGIIAEIKSSKKKIKPSDPKQKEQIEIIDQFIKSKPSIGKNKSSTGNTDDADLTENSAVFSDNIVSETLVEILIKQGKREKAVEVLRKLIWKFPQKKAYFAAQIEELTS